MVQPVKETHAPAVCDAGSNPVAVGCNRLIYFYYIPMSLHTKEHDAILAEMTPQQKIDRMKPSAMRDRWIVVAEYRYWILCKNEFPYVWYTDSLVLWYKVFNNKRPHWLARVEKWRIQMEWEERGYSVQRNNKKDRSIPRYHEHFLLK